MMQDSFVVDTGILSNEEVVKLRDYYSETNSPFMSRDYNLYNVYKTDRLGPVPGWFREINKKLTIKSGCSNLRALYYLEYIPGSFCTMHQDNPETVKRTAVILLDKSPDLIGGDTIVEERFKFFRDNTKKVRPDDTNQELNIKLPVVVNQPIGSVLWYDQSLAHCVTKVKSGKRLVLILWFNNYENN